MANGKQSANSNWQLVKAGTHEAAWAEGCSSKQQIAFGN
jgi:hypothetical protein